MPNAENAIFICYRREDSNSAARGIYERMKVAFGEKAVFLDHFGFLAGDEWRAKTKPILEQARAVVVIVHKDWVEIGRKRLKDRDDPVRQELELALSRDDLEIVPVTIDRTSFSASAALKSLAEDADSELSTLLGKLFAKTAAKVRFDRDFESDIQGVIARLDAVHGIDRVAETASYDVGGLQVIRIWETSARRPAHRAHDAKASDLWILQPKYRSIPLVSRERDMAGLKAWFDSPQPISARLLIGRAGAGKTRMALEFLWGAFRDRSDRWDVGILKGESLRQPRDWNAWSWNRPTLLVIDYALALHDAVSQMFLALARKDQDPNLPPLRVLLLEREASATEGWFAHLLEQEDSSRGGSVRDLFDPSEPVPLQPLETAENRRDILRETLALAAEVEGKPPLVVPEEGVDPAFDEVLRQGLWNEPLYLMMAALEAARRDSETPAGENGKLIGALRLGRVDLAKAVAERELKRLELFVPHGVDAAPRRRLLRHLAGVATLCGGFDAEQALAAAEEESQALHLNWPSGAGDVADRLHQALPARDDGVAAVQPDLIGEALVLLALTDGLSQKQQGECVVRAAGRNVQAVAASVLRSFQNFQVDQRAATRLLSWFDALFAACRDDDPTWLEVMTSVLPNETTALRQRAATIVELLYKSRVAQLSAASSSSCDREEVARLASELSIRLSDLGRRREALQRAEESVTIRRELANSSSDAFLPALAGSLNNLGIQLISCGRCEEALQATQESVEIYRCLAASRPDVFHPALARTLDNLGGQLSRLGRRDEAYRATEEAVEIHRQLTDSHSDTFSPTLTISLAELLKRSVTAGPIDLENVLRGLDFSLIRYCAPSRPDFRIRIDGEMRSDRDERNASLLNYCGYRADRRSEYRPALAGSLYNHGTHLRDLGRYGEALRTMEEALAIYRILAGTRPDAFVPDLARSLGAVGEVLFELRAFPQANVLLTEAIRKLLPAFQELPIAFNALMDWIVRIYDRNCMAGGVDPDEGLLNPIRQALAPWRTLSDDSDLDV